MNKPSSLLAFVVGSAALLSSVGCASNSGGNASTGTDVAAIDEASDSNDTESNVESLSTTFIGGSSGEVKLASAAGLTEAPGALQPADIGDGAKAYFVPSGCLTVTSTASSASYVFADCTGPYGLVHLSGTIAVTYTATSATELKLTFSATGFAINKATIDWSASADITADGLNRSMAWNGMFSGTTRNGRAISRTNQKTYAWTEGGSCLSVNGTSTGNVSGDSLTTDVISYSRCKAACPEAGSEIKITDNTTMLTYDVKWTSTGAEYTAPSGKTYDFTPLCALE